MRARKKGGDREPLIIRERHVQAFQHLQSQPVRSSPKSSQALYAGTARSDARNFPMLGELKPCEANDMPPVLG